jgi:uncharacterized protein
MSKVAEVKSLSTPQKRKADKEDELVHYSIVKKSKLHRFGAFAPHSFEKGDIVEQCVVLKIPEEDAENNILADYMFDYDDEMVCILLGNGGIYNHSYKPNLEHQWGDEEQTVVEFVALKNIKKSEELLINYGRGYWKGKGKPSK